MNAGRAKTIAYWFTTGFLALEFAVVTLASWLLRPRSRMLAAVPPSRRMAASLGVEASPAVAN